MYLTVNAESESATPTSLLAYAFFGLPARMRDLQPNESLVHPVRARPIQGVGASDG